MRSRTAVAVVLALLLPLLGQPRVEALAYRYAAPRFSWVPNGTVFAILVAGDTVYVGGAFTQLRNPATGRVVRRERLAAFDRRTGRPTRWDPGADDTVRALARGRHGVVFAGGSFLHVGGRSAQRVVALRPDGSRVRGWRASASGTVRAILPAGERLFVAGEFGVVNGVPRSGVASLNLRTGALVRRFDARVGGGAVVTLDTSARGELVLGGTFHAVRGVDQPFLAMVRPRTGRLVGWRPPPVCAECPLFDLDVVGTRVFAAIGGRGGRVAAWRTDVDQRLWSVDADGDVQAVDVRAGTVFVGGHFGPGFAGQTRHQFAALSVGGTLLPATISFTGSDGPGIWAVSARKDALRLGGGFAGIAGSASARFCVLPRA